MAKFLLNFLLFYLIFSLLRKRHTGFPCAKSGWYSPRPLENNCLELWIHFPVILAPFVIDVCHTCIYLNIRNLNLHMIISLDIKSCIDTSINLTLKCECLVQNPTIVSRSVFNSTHNSDVNPG